jgi:hypothetical protein
MWVMEFGTFADVELRKTSACAFYESDYWGRANVRAFQPTHLCDTFEYKSDLRNYRGCIPDGSHEINTVARLPRVREYEELLSIIVCSGSLKATSL